MCLSPERIKFKVTKLAFSTWKLSIQYYGVRVKLDSSVGMWIMCPRRAKHTNSCLNKLAVWKSNLKCWSTTTRTLLYQFRLQYFLVHIWHRSCVSIRNIYVMMNGIMLSSKPWFRYNPRRSQTFVRFGKIYTQENTKNRSWEITTW